MTTPSASSTPRNAPGPRGHHLVGSLPEFRDNMPQTLLHGAREFGDVVRFTAGPRVIHLFRHPDAVKHVLQDHSANYGRQTRGYDMFKETIGDGLLSSDGDFWRRQRRIAQPAFHKQRIAGFATAMADAAVELADRLRAATEPLDATTELLRATLRILGFSLFSIDLSGTSDAIGKALTTVLHHTTDATRSIIHIPEIIPTPQNRRFKSALDTLDRVVFSMIDERRRGGVHKDDLLSMLLEARDEETGEGMTDQQLRDELVGFVLAGHETTAMTLSWTLVLLSRYPAARRRLEAELEFLGGRPPVMEEFGKLPFLKAVIEESMRLYPPAWMVPRSVADDDVVGGFHVPAGSIAIVSPFVTHRDPRLWQNPEGFDPDRFLDGSERTRYAYFPFGGGPHLCIGAGFAMMEAEIMLATIVQRVRLDLVEGHPIEHEALITLRPKHGVLVTAHPR